MSTLTKTTRLSPGTGKSSAFPVLVHRVDNPVDARIIADLDVGRIHENDFVIFHGSILVDPIGVENPQVAEFTSNLLLGHRLEIALEFDLIDTLIFGLTVDHTAVVGPLAPSATDAAADDDVSLLRLVTKAVRFVSAGRMSHASDLGALAVLPGAEAQ